MGSPEERPSRPSEPPSLDQEVRVLAGLVSKKVHGYVTLGELTTFALTVCDMSHTMKDYLKKGSARAIMNRIGNGSRTTVPAYASWLSAYFHDFSNANPTRWKNCIVPWSSHFPQRQIIADHIRVRPSLFLTGIMWMIRI